MSNIPMVDLRSQYLAIKPEVDQAIQSVIDQTAFVGGQAVNRFAAHLSGYLNAPFVLPCGNGTDALQLALMTLDVEPGDEIITVPFTFVATVEVISLLGLKPVFVDVEPDTFCLDVSKLESALTPRTKAIIPVHLFGQCADMKGIMAFSARHNLAVIEDNAQAIGSSYDLGGQVKKAGTIGHIGCTSFYPSKNLGCYGDGGAVFTNDEATYQKLKTFANHGMGKERYIYETVGINSRLDGIQAAVLDVKLRHLDQYNQNRLQAANYYDEGLKHINGIKIPVRSARSSHVFHQYTIQIENNRRDQVRAYLQEKGVPTGIFYPIPLHLHHAYANLGYKRGDFTVSERLSDQVLSLPMHSELKSSTQDVIIEHLTNSLNIS